MHTKQNKPYGYPALARTALALKAARLKRGLSRKDAAKLLGWSPGSFEQIENARCNISEARAQHILAAYEVTPEDFAQILRDPKRVIAQFCNDGRRDPSVERKPRRNHFKIVTKEVRVLRALRKRRQITQYEASRLCGYIPGGFGHVEVGRITLTPRRIEHILGSLGYTRADFDSLLAAPLLRDDLIEECHKAISQLPDSKLESALGILNALTR